MNAISTTSTALMEFTDRPDLVFVSGNGSWIFDNSGKRYLDFVQGWAVNCLGHSSPIVVKALISQAAKLINCSPAYFNAPAIRLADLIAAHCSLHKVFFANTGAEANEGAVKLARKWGKKHRGGASSIITMERGFHGRSLAMMAASGKPHWEKLFEPNVPGFRKVPLNDVAAVEAAISADTVAVMLEPIQGEAGVYPAADAYIRDLRELTRRYGVLLILDEVQTGVGRTGAMFAHQHAAVLPDIMTLGKGLGAGVPLAALVAHRDVCCFEHGDQGGTFNGTPLMTAVGCAVMEELSRPGFLDRVVETGRHLEAALVAISARFGFGGVRGRGLLLALDLGRDLGPAVVACARAHGLLLNAPHAQCLRFMPALNVRTAEIDGMCEILSQVCKEVA